jgi:type IV pilus assembly protein PilB
MASQANVDQAERSWCRCRALMSFSTAAALSPLAESTGDYPRGLIAPTRRGRSHRLIGDVIVDLELAARETVEEAVALAREHHSMTGQVLIDSGALRHDQLARALAERLGIEYVDLSLFDIDLEAVNLLSVEVARRYQAVPVGFLADQTVLLAMADPTNVLTIDEISMMVGMKVSPAAAAPQDVMALLGRLNPLEGAAFEVEEAEPELEVPYEKPDSDAPLVRLVHSIIAQAIEQGASDIHCDPGVHEMRVLFRIDGVLRPAVAVARSRSSALVSRIKIMASLDIAERRVPQDGRLAVTVDGRRVDIRVVTLPLVGGEGVVMRVLDTGRVERDLDMLGMNGTARERFVAAVGRPYGAVLVTGPTGSGKSTTLYSAISIVNDGQRSILTIEDPVESQIAGVKQMQVSAKTGVTFANGLRSMLRADPDVIMVGEIRDRETAEISIQAALTGHLVLSTLHTRDAPSAVTRMIDMGIEPFMVASAIDCVVAQRLARRLCEQCKRPAARSAMTIEEPSLDDVELFEPAGCIRCAWTGYRGRVGLYEVMPMAGEIRALVLERGGVDQIADAGKGLGMRSMREDGIEKVRRGLTSLVEVNRVTMAL